MVYGWNGRVDVYHGPSPLRDFRMQNQALSVTNRQRKLYKAVASYMGGGWYIKCPRLGRLPLKNLFFSAASSITQVLSSDISLGVFYISLSYTELQLNQTKYSKLKSPEN